MSRSFAQQNALAGAIKEKEKEGVVIPYLHSCFAFVYSSRLGYYYGV
jgi:hypothetical protein